MSVKIMSVVFVLIILVLRAQLEEFGEEQWCYEHLHSHFFLIFLSGKIWNAPLELQKLVNLMFSQKRVLCS